MACFPAGSISSATLGAAALALVTASAGAEEAIHWPCKRPYTEALSIEQAWGGPPPSANGDWHADAAVRELVLYATNPENNPDKGRAAISEYARSAGAHKDEGLALAFDGMFEEMNTYYGIIINGIQDFTVRAKILEDAVKENEAQLAALPPDAAEERHGLRVARMWNFRNMDDAEEEAEFQCHRLAYLEKKLGLLAERLKEEMGSH